jgi:hypothetical protein
MVRTFYYAIRLLKQTYTFYFVSREINYNFNCSYLPIHVGYHIRVDGWSSVGPTSMDLIKLHTNRNTVVDTTLV